MENVIFDSVENTENLVNENEEIIENNNQENIVEIENQKDVIFDENEIISNGEENENCANGMGEEKSLCSETPESDAICSDVKGDETVCERPSKVYVKRNEVGEIVEINSDIFIDNLDGWEYLDEGFGDKYSHAQSQYIEK